MGSSLKQNDTNKHIETCSLDDSMQYKELNKGCILIPCIVFIMLVLILCFVGGCNYGKRSNKVTVAGTDTIRVEVKDTIRVNTPTLVYTKPLKSYSIIYIYNTPLFQQEVIE